jgi:dihydrolipoamide dehydrogenase
VDYVKGFGKIAGANAVNVKLNEGGETTLQTKNILIATGQTFILFSLSPSLK